MPVCKRRPLSIMSVVTVCAPPQAVILLMAMWIMSGKLILNKESEKLLSILD